MFDVVACGDLLIDFIQKSCKGDSFPLLDANAGGASANYISALASLGAKTAFFGKVGNDSFGSLLKNMLRSKGVDVSFVLEDSSVFTTLAFVTLDKLGERSFSFARKPGADTQLKKHELPYNYIKNTKIFHFGSLMLTNEPSRSSVKKAIEIAKKNNVIVSFDANLRAPLWDNLKNAKAEMLYAISKCDILKLNLEEAEFLLNTDIKTAAEILHNKYNVSLVLITIGDNGCYYKHKNSCGHINGFCLNNTIDTTGAGDIFTAAFTYLLLKTKKPLNELSEDDLTQIITFANAFAALSTTKHGGISSIPTLSQALKLLDTRIN